MNPGNGTRKFPGKMLALTPVMQTKTDIANLVRACAPCGVLHASGYRCANERKGSRYAAMYPVWTATPTVSILAKGTK